MSSKLDSLVTQHPLRHHPTQPPLTPPSPSYLRGGERRGR